MESNGKGMTQQELINLPEVDAVLWQEDGGPSYVIDSQGRKWVIGTHEGRLCKRRFLG